MKLESQESFRLALQGRYRLWDFIRACSLYVGINPAIRVLGVILLIISTSVGLASLFEGDNYAVTALGLGIPLLSAWAVFWKVPRQWNSPFLRRSGSDCEICASEAGLFFAAQARQREWGWMFFIGWIEGDGCFLLTLADGCFEFVPKHFFHSREEVNAFRALLARSIEPRQRMLFSKQQATTLNRRIEDGANTLGSLADLLSMFSKK